MEVKLGERDKEGKLRERECEGDDERHGQQHEEAPVMENVSKKSGGRHGLINSRGGGRGWTFMAHRYILCVSCLKLTWSDPGRHMLLLATGMRLRYKRFSLMKKEDVKNVVTLSPKSSSFRVNRGKFLRGRIGWGGGGGGGMLRAIPSFRAHHFHR
ncbi:hypothetical protein Pmani_030103 [Petrolisthes manimaculis]|uniref:Uncharacterized protein n=1 Tax=Petrolisthes manimaculis TaxID=1843537 RepID=A0AAE1TTT7_9EUCA|nr:hypothetical protein Pmani_030103 [Petrolisthes manimaculis]